MWRRKGIACILWTGRVHYGKWVRANIYLIVAIELLQSQNMLLETKKQDSEVKDVSVLQQTKSVFCSIHNTSVKYSLLVSEMKSSILEFVTASSHNDKGESKKLTRICSVKYTSKYRLQNTLQQLALFIQITWCM